MNILFHRRKSKAFQHHSLDTDDAESTLPHEMERIPSLEQSSDNCQDSTDESVEWEVFGGSTTPLSTTPDLHLETLAVLRRTGIVCAARLEQHGTTLARNNQDQGLTESRETRSAETTDGEPVWKRRFRRVKASVIDLKASSNSIEHHTIVRTKSVGTVGSPFSAPRALTSAEIARRTKPPSAAFSDELIGANVNCVAEAIPSQLPRKENVDGEDSLQRQASDMTKILQEYEVFSVATPSVASHSWNGPSEGNLSPSTRGTNDQESRSSLSDESAMHMDYDYDEYDDEVGCAPYMFRGKDFLKALGVSKDDLEKFASVFIQETTCDTFGDRNSRKKR